MEENEPELHMTTSASTTRSIPSQPISCPSIRLVQEAMSDVKGPMMPSALAACLVDALANAMDYDDPMTPSSQVPTPAISHSSSPRTVYTMVFYGALSINAMILPNALNFQDDKEDIVNTGIDEDTRIRG